MNIELNQRSTPVAIALSLICCFSCSIQAASDKPKKPLWELGIAAGVLSIPHYVGSDQRYTLPLALPYVIYRGDIVKADSEGVRGDLFRHESLSVDLGFSFGLPVSNDNNRAREGMPDLHLTGQVGPRLNWVIRETEKGVKSSFHLPVRYVGDIKRNSLGWVAEPNFRIQADDMGKNSRLSLRFTAGLLYAGQPYNQYYYGVEQRFALDTRPEYRASSGLSNYFLSVAGTYKLSKRLSLNGFMQYRTLASDTVRDSPLVKDDYYLSFGIGLSWIFKQSE